MQHLQSEDNVWEKLLIEMYNSHFSTSQQNVFTPFYFIRKMINKINIEFCEYICVFNIEFAYILIKQHKIDPSKIIAWSDNEYKASLYSKLGIFQFIQGRLFNFKAYL